MLSLPFPWIVTIAIGIVAVTVDGGAGMTTSSLKLVQVLNSGGAGSDDHQYQASCWQLRHDGCRRRWHLLCYSNYWQFIS